MTILAYVFLGVAAGGFGSLLGLGGGIFLIPAFLFVCSFSPQQAVGTALFVVFLNAVSGAAAYMRQGNVVRRAAVAFGLATIPGAFLGSYAVDLFSGQEFIAAFGFFLLVIAFSLYKKAKPQKQGGEEPAEDIPAYKSWQGISCSVGVGFLASVLGIGGGVIHVPFMLYVLKFPIRAAIATSTCILAISSLSGVLSHAWLGHIVWLPALAVGSGAMIGAQFGARLAGKIKASSLQRLMAFVIGGIALKFIAAGW